jgi:MYXO-CTERM domain-containing protein
VLWIAQVPKATIATICTASLISPHVLLTAAHCVTPELVGADAQYRYYQGPDVNSASSRELHPIPTVHFHAEFSSTDVQKGHDIAVGVLDVPLTNTAPLTLNTRPIDGDLVGQPVRLVGYGKDSGTDTTGASAGVKRQVSTRLNSYTDDLLRLGQSGMTTCEGDSGGPAFMTVDGAERIVGVVSFGDASCAELGVDTRVDVFADDWVRPFVEAADPGFLPPVEEHGCAMAGSEPPRYGFAALALAIVLFARRRTLTKRSIV